MSKNTKKNPKVTTDQELLTQAKETLRALTSSKDCGRIPTVEEQAAISVSLFVGNKIIQLIEQHIIQSSAPDEEVNTAVLFSSNP